MRLLAPEHIMALTDAQTWRDNPFIRRDWRRDVKRKQPLKSFAWMAATLALLGGLGIWGLFRVVDSLKGVPWFLGGDIGTALCILLAGIHVWFIAGASQKHTVTMLTQEASRHTLSHLLLLPLSPFQWLLQASVYPWLAAMRTALVLFPLYALCVSLGGISWLDLMMLYLVFAMTAVSLPVWRRPALSDAVASGVVAAPVAAGGASGTFGSASSQQNQTAAQGGSGGSSGGWSAFLFVGAMMSFVMSLSSGQGLGGWYQNLNRYIPDSILVLLPSSMLSWPLMGARALITPFDWYGFHLWPLPFVVTVFLINRYTLLVRTVEFLQVGTYRDLALQPTYQPRRRLEAVVRMVQLFFVMGYFWRWLIWDGALARIAHPGTTEAPGLGGFLYAMLFVAVWRGLVRAATVGRWLIPSRTPEGALARRNMAWKSTLKFLLEPLATGIGLYTLCCLAGRTNPFPAAVAALAGKMLVIGVAGMALALTANRVLGFLVMLNLGIVPLAIYGPPMADPVVFFSPSYGLLYQSAMNMANMGGPPSVPAWSMWPLAMGGAALLLLPLVLLWVSMARKRPVGTEAMAFDPTEYGAEVYMDASVRQAATTSQSESPLVQALIRCFQMLGDNAVTVKEMRAGMRGKLLPRSLGKTFAIYSMISFALSQDALSGFGFLGRGFASMLYTRPPDKSLWNVVNMTGCWYVALFITAFFAGGSLLLCLVGERDKSTLGFLMMTPMRTASILLGKFVGVLTSNGLSTGLIALWTLALSTMLSIQLREPTPLFAWAKLSLVALLMAITIGMLSLMLACLFWKAMRPGMTGWLWFVCFQLLGQSGGLANWGFSLLQSVGLPDNLLWVFGILFVLLLNLLAFFVAWWGIGRLRKGDIAFAAAKRDN